MKATVGNGERVTLTKNTRNLGHGVQIEVVYQDGTSGWEHEEDLIDMEEEESELTYDVHFNDETSSNSKGFKTDYDYCKNYIAQNNGTNNSYFEDYKSGTVSIVCNETGETVYEEPVR